MNADGFFHTYLSNKYGIVQLAFWGSTVEFLNYSVFFPMQTLMLHFIWVFAFCISAHSCVSSKQRIILSNVYLSETICTTYISSTPIQDQCYGLKYIVWTSFCLGQFNGIRPRMYIKGLLCQRDADGPETMTTQQQVWLWLNKWLEHSTLNVVINEV